MRVALVSPYSWTYPGGVTRHIEALAGELDRAGPRRARARAVRPRRRAATALLHRGARPQVRDGPEWLVPLGGTIGWPSNGAVSNLAAHADARSATLRRELRAGALRRRPPARAGRAGRRLGRADERRRATRRHVPLLLREPRRRTRSPRCSAPAASSTASHVRIAVSEAAAWTGRRFYGGRLPGRSPTASRCPPAARRRRARARPGEPLRIVFVGQAVERKGLPVLLRAFEALRGQVPAELTVIGATAGGARAAAGRRRRRDRARPRRRRRASSAALRDADVLCAPSLGGESFGMVLTEAFAAGTPVVASDIAGYRDVVARRRRRAARPARRRDARWPRRCATSRSTRARTSALGAGAAAQRRALRLAAGRRAGRRGLRGRARRARAGGRAAARRGPDRRAARRRPAARARAPAAVARAARRRAAARAAARRAPRRLVGAAPARPPAARCSRSSTSACDRIGARARRRPSPAWVLVGAGADVRLDARCAPSPGTRSCKAALPDARPRLRRRRPGHDDRRADVRDAAGAARRAVARADRRAPARPRRASALPVVLGTLVSQTLLNVLALVILGAVMFTTIGLFAGRQQALRLVRAGAVRRALRSCSSRPRCSAPACRRAPRACTRWLRAGARRARARALRPARLPPPARWASRP